MALVLGRAVLRIALVVGVAVTFQFLVEAALPAVESDPRPWLERYLDYWTTILTPPVWRRVSPALPWSVVLLGVGTVLAFGIGTITGAWLARVRRRSASVTLVGAIVIVLASVPSFLLGMCLVAVFAVQLRLLPGAAGFTPALIPGYDLRTAIDLAAHFLLPVASIALAGAGVFAVLMRGSVTSITTEDHRLYAESLGLPERRLYWAYELRPALPAQVTALALVLGTAAAGAILVEAKFSYPGLGYLLYRAIITGERDLARGITFVLIVGLALAIAVIELAYPRLDPRVRGR
jgi:peptide/nickel transport system permease protein